MSAMLKMIIQVTCSELICSYAYYDAFHQGSSANWQIMEAMFPEQTRATYINHPVPRTRNPQIEVAQDTDRQLYHEIGDRDIDPDMLAQLNTEMRDGTHPTTQALVPLGLRFLKILGAGSQGTAVLFEMDSDDGTTRKIVAKYDTGGDEDGVGLLDEKAWMRVSGSGQDI